MKGQFERYVNLIRKSAHFYANKWNVDYEEVEAQGFLIYCKCLEDYKVAQSKFSTYLTWELKRLNDFCKTYLRQQGYLIEDYFTSLNENNLAIIDIIPAYDENSTLSELLEMGLKYLSSEAYNLFSWILRRTWERKGRLKPSITLVMNTFSYSREKATSLWNEIGNFYNTALVSL